MLSTLLPRAAALLVLSILAGLAASVQERPASAGTTSSPTRGRLLYDAHCIECHNVQVHWRTPSQVSDWKSLLEQVDRWQAAGQLHWTEEDKVEVMRHLNDSFYKFPLPRQRASR